MNDKIKDIDSTEKKVIVSNYFGKDKVIKQFPTKEKRKLILLDYISEQYFSRNRKYIEKEVNEILKPIFHDYVKLRRDLIEYRFLDRSRDCSEYWVR